MDATLRALNGFGLGARPGERQRVGDPRGWLRAQLQGGAPVIAAPPEATPDAIRAALRAFRMAAQPQGTQDREMARQQARRRLVEIGAAEGRAALTARAASSRPFVERLVAFWSNHFCVSTGAKVLVAPLAGSYERDAIRPHVLGRFEDMVLASAKHPAMLVYLDNFQSIGPRSRGAQSARGRTRRGLNENYARELLELHTLGVDGGYTQQDVQELAKILTGWTVDGLRDGAGAPRRPQARRGAAAPPGNADPNDDSIAFAFQPALHEPGEKTVLATRYRESGPDEGEQAIRALCRHPSTARFVAGKLVAHFAGDAPPKSAVDRVATVFRETDGNLRSVAGALIDLPDAWSDGARKFRTPQDWVVAVLRAFDGETVADLIMPTLRQLRHPLWSPGSPKGFGDTTQEWADPDSLLNRAELARGIARRLRLPRDSGALDPRRLLDVVDVPENDPLRTLIADASIAAEERIALALAGPAFQWR